MDPCRCNLLLLTDVKENPVLDSIKNRAGKKKSKVNDFNSSVLCHILSIALQYCQIQLVASFFTAKVLNTALNIML